MRSRTTFAALVLALLAGLSACTGSSGTPVASTPAIQVYAAEQRKAAPALTGKLLDGSGTFDLAAHRGQVVVLNFWASWCAPCVLEADDLEETYQATEGANVAFLGINTRDELDGAKAFVVGRTTYPSVFDPSGRIALGFAVPPSSIPATVIIDRQGRVAAVALGSILRSELEPVVTQLAAEQVGKSGG